MDRRGKSSKPKRLAPTLALAFVVLLAAWMGVANGGLFVADWSPAVLALAALALVASVAGALSPAASRWAAVALGLFAAYAGWTFISLLWSPNRGNAWFGAGLTLLYLLAFWVSLGLVPLGASRRWALAASAIGPAAVAASTLATLVPRAGELFEEDGRLIGTVGYANGEAAFLLAPFWAAVYLGGSPRVHPAVRGLVLAGAVLCASLAVLTQSRGAMFAVAASAAVFFVLSGQRLRGLFALAPIALALVVAYPGLNDVYLSAADQEAARAAIGRALPAVWLAAAGAGLCGLLWGLADRRWSPPSSVTRAVGGVALAGVIVVLVLGTVAFVGRAGNPVDWGEQRWEAFKADDAVEEEQSRFLSASGSGRYTYWRVAWEDFAQRPLLGVGTHNYEATYYQKRERAGGAVRQPHSLPLEVLAERGLVGGFLFFGFLAACVGAGLRQRFGPLDAEGKGQVGAMVAAVCYWFFHSGIDWFWQLPAVTLPAVVYLAMLVGPWQRTEAAAPPRWPLRAIGAVAAALAMLAVAPLYVAARYSQHSYAVQDPKEALAAAERAQRFIPVDPSVRQQVARNAELVGDWGRAEDAYRDAIRLNPRHFLPYTQLARFYELRGRPDEALPFYQKALALNPLDAAYEVGLNRRVIDLLARAPVDATPVRFMGGGDELGRLTLTVANGSREREQALRGSEPLPRGAGELLVWPADDADPLRVEGATEPAEVAFADADGNVTEVASVDGPDEEVRPRQPYRLAIEANRGFFEEHGIGPGDRAVFAASP